MDMLTNQEIFDKGTVHLMEQGVCAVDRGTGSCKYRTPEGLKCAIGALIPDSIYRSSFEGESITGLIKWYPEEMAACGMDKSNLSVLRNMQGIHDSSTSFFRSKKYWYDQLTTFAEGNNLDTTVLEKYDVNQ